jgi:hypothetical protein
MIRGISNFSVPSLSHAAANNGRMSLPVNSSFLVYSHLKHVSGVPAPEGSQGITISKLHILDALIGQFNQIKTGGVSPNPTGGLDALIEGYKRQIEQAKAASQVMPYIPSPSAGPGMLLSLST